MDRRLLCRAGISYALAIGLIASPRAGFAQQSPEYLVGQDDARGPTLSLPRPIEYAKARSDHPATHPSRLIRADDARRLARLGSGRAARIPAPMPELGAASPVARAAKQGDILPGLPGALVAVVEGGTPATATSSSSVPAPGIKPAEGVSPAAAPSAPSGPVSLTATVLDDPDPSLRGLFFPFEAAVGAAAFSRGDDLLVVFDAARPFDLSSVQDDPVGARSSIQLLPEATILRLRMDHAKNVVLRRFPTGWLIQANAPDRRVKAIVPVMDGGVLRLPVDDAGRTVVVPDPETGGNLLVGTIRSGHDAVETRRRGTAEIIEQTVQGVVIDPLSDKLELHPVTHAFLLSGTGVDAVDVRGGIPGQEPGRSTAISRIMSLAAGSPEALYRRFKEAKAAAAAAPSESRFALRLLAAQDALALGDAEEAATITKVAVADDARQAAAIGPKLIAAAAALLERHPDAVDLLDEPQAGAEGEIGLWRAVKLAERDVASPEAARLFAVALPLLRSYPAPLQAALLPLAAMSLVRGGSDAQAALVDQLPAEHGLAFARAILAERRGQTQVALTALDRLGLDPEAGLADLAVEEAVAMRRTSSGSDPRKLADILEGHLLDARIAGHDVASRFHLAEMRAQGGEWQKALDLLRETAVLYPEQENETRRRAGQVLARLAAAPLKTGDGEALAQAAMIETNAGMLPEGADGSRISLFLAARLSALDLPERAALIVRQMMRLAQPGTAKAELGLRLAELDFQQNDLAGVRAALQESDPGGLPPSLAVPRLIMMARSLAGDGQLDQALAAIASVKTSAGLDLKAGLLARRGDWGGATDVLLAMARQDQPAGGKLDGADQDLLLRLASAASRSQDRDRIKQVSKLGTGRFADPAKEALFGLLVSDAAADGSDPTKVSSNISTLRRAPAVFDSISK